MVIETKEPDPNCAYLFQQNQIFTAIELNKTIVYLFTQKKKKRIHAHAKKRKKN